MRDSEIKVNMASAAAVIKPFSRASPLLLAGIFSDGIVGAGLPAKCRHIGSDTEQAYSVTSGLRQ